MKCEGIVIYKGIEKREGGVFKNDKGQEINYNSSYVIKFDEVVNGKIDERKLKFPEANTVLEHKFKELEPYTKVKIFCDVVLSNSSCKLVPIDVTADIEENK